MSFQKKAFLHDSSRQFLGKRRLSLQSLRGPEMAQDSHGESLKTKFFWDSHWTQSIRALEKRDSWQLFEKVLRKLSGWAESFSLWVGDENIGETIGYYHHLEKYAFQTTYKVERGYNEKKPYRLSILDKILWYNVFLLFLLWCSKYNYHTKKNNHIFRRWQDSFQVLREIPKHDGSGAESDLIYQLYYCVREFLPDEIFDEFLEWRMSDPRAVKYRASSLPCPVPPPSILHVFSY